MNKNVTLQTIDKDLKRELRINNYLQVWNRNQLIQANQNIVGSTIYLSNQIDSLGGSLSKAINEQTFAIQEGMSEIQTSLASVGKTLQLQTSILRATLNTLDEIHDTLKHPEEVKSKEQFERGVQWIEKGFLAEAVEAFKSSIEKNPTNYLSHYYLGVLYLCGKDEDDDVVDLEKSEEELKLAVKYSRPDRDNRFVKQYIVAIHQNLSDLYYKLAESGNNPAKNYELAKEELEQAIKVDSSRETVVSLTSRLIHCANRLGNKSDVIQYASFGFLNDSSSLVYLVDEDLSEYREGFIQIIDKVRPLLIERINDSLTKEETYDLSVLDKIINITNDEDLNSYTALSFIYDLLSEGKRRKKTLKMDRETMIELVSSMLYEYIILCRINNDSSNPSIEIKEEQIKQLFILFDKEINTWIDLFDEKRLQMIIKNIKCFKFVNSLDHIFIDGIKKYYDKFAQKYDSFINELRKSKYPSSDVPFFGDKAFILPSGRTINCSDCGYDKISSRNVEKTINGIVERKESEHRKAEKSLRILNIGAVITLIILVVLFFRFGSQGKGGAQWLMIGLGVIGVLLYAKIEEDLKRK